MPHIFKVWIERSTRILYSSTIINKKCVEAFYSIKYNYIIINGETADLVLVARLSENKSVNVAVLKVRELKQNDSYISILFWSFSIVEDFSYDWMFKIMSQIYSLCLIQSSNLFHSQNVLLVVNKQQNSQLTSWQSCWRNQLHQQSSLHAWIIWWIWWLKDFKK